MKQANKGNNRSILHQSVKTILERLNVFEEQDLEQNSLNKAHELEEFRRLNPDSWPSTISKNE